jgi:hypothetical protein
MQRTFGVDDSLIDRFSIHQKQFGNSWLISSIFSLSLLTTWTLRIYDGH